jgi:spore maturation protein CgeB
MKEIYARSVINMGFGYTGGSSSVVLKGRDFEVPVSGGLYLTSYNAEMEKYFTPGKEIEFYHDETELLRKVQFYLANVDLALRIGAAGRDKCLKNHTWQNRFQHVLDVVYGAQS